MAGTGDHHQDHVEKPTPPAQGASLEHKTAELFRQEIKPTGSLSVTPERPPAGPVHDRPLTAPKLDPANELKALTFDAKIYAGTFTKDIGAGNLPTDKFKPTAPGTDEHLTVLHVRINNDGTLPVDPRKPGDGPTPKPPGDAPTPRPPGDAPPATGDKQTPEQKMLDPSVTPEQKIAIAKEMYEHGQKSFKGPDGQKYDINEQKVGGRTLIGVFTNDAHGHTQVALRGIVEKDGHVSKQVDSKGHPVDYESNYAKHHDGAGLRHDSVDKHDGSKYTSKPDGHGGVTETHTGTKPEQNYTKDIHADKSTTVVDSKGNRTDTSADGQTVNYHGADGKNYVHQPDGKGGYTENHTGPKPEDNYTVSGDGKGNSHEVHAFPDDPSKNYTKDVRPDNSSVVTDAKGNKTTTSADGKTVTYEGVDKTGYVRQKTDDQGGFTENHTGPKPEDNYQVKGDGKGNNVETRNDGHGNTRETFTSKDDPSKNYTKDTHPDHSTTVTDAKGNKTNTSPDGLTVTYEGVDGKKSIHQAKSDGSFTDTHSGPNPADNYKESGDGKGNNVLTRDDGHGNKIEKHTSTDDPSKNYTKETHADKSVTITDSQGNRTTTSGDNKTVTYSGADGRGFVRHIDDKGGFTETHTGQNQADNYKLSGDGKGNNVETRDLGNGNTRELHTSKDDPTKNFTKDTHPDGSTDVTDAQGHHTHTTRDGKVTHDDKPQELLKPTEKFEPQTKLTDEKFVEVGKQVLLKINPDGSPATKDQLIAAMNNPEFKGEQAQALAAMYKGFDQLHNIAGNSSGVFGFFKSDTVSAKDLEKYPAVTKAQQDLVNKDYGDKWWADKNFQKFAGPDGVMHNSDISKALKDPNLSADDRTHLADMQKLIAEKGHPDNPNDPKSDKGITTKDIDKAIEDLPKTDAAKMQAAMNWAMDLTVQSQNEAHGEHNLYSTGNPLDSIKPDAIKQGTVGDCYFEAAVGSVAAEHPEIIQNMIKANPDGTYTVTFPGEPDKPQTVKPPTEAEQGLYNHGTKYGVWASVLEKAYGQLEQNKNFIKGETGQEEIGHAGFSHKAMELLTGKKSEYTYVNENTNTQQLGAQIQAALDAHHPVTASSLSSSGGSDQEQTSDHYAKNHAYSIIGFTPDGHGGGTVKVRNPWGNNTTDPGGTSEIPLSKFIKNFNFIYVNNA